MLRARSGRRLSRLATAGLAVLPVLGTTALITANAPSASAVISGNVLSGTPSAMWQTNSEVDALAMANGVIYAGGKFTSVRPPGAAAGSQETARSYLAAFSASTGALITTFNVALDSRIAALDVSPDGSRLYIGGNFTTVNGTARARMAAVNSATVANPGALVTAFNPQPNKGVTAIDSTTTTVYLGGDFTTVRSVARTNMASVTAAAGALNTAFNPTLVAGPPAQDTVPSARVNAIAVSSDGSRVLTGGSFQTVNNVLTGGMVSLDPIDASLEQWNANNLGQQPINTNCGGRVTDIVTSGTTAYVTGEGDPPGCYEGTYSADIATGTINWNASCLGASQGLAIAGGVLYKGSHQHDCAYMQGGAFGGFVGGIAREAFVHRYLVGQDVRDGSFVHWSPNTNATATGGTTSVGPQVMASDGTQVIVGGDFTTVTGVQQAGLARFQPNGDTATPELPGKNYNGDPFSGVTPFVVSRLPVTVQPTAARTLTVEVPAVHDPDTGTLTYRIYRDNGTTPIASMQAESWAWSKPVLRYDDTGLVAGSTHSYRVDATDGTRTSAKSTAVSGTVRTAAPASFADTIAALNPATWWRLGDSGTTVADSSSTPHPGSTQGGVTRGQSGVLSEDSAVTLDGSTGYLTSDTTIDNPVAFSESLWFKTTTLKGGVLMAQSSVQTGPGGTTDRLLAMDNNGNVVFGIGRNAIRNQGTIWNDGKWHQAVGTYDGAGTANLYVDGWLQSCAVPASTPASVQCLTITRPPAPPASGYLRAGYADLTARQLVFGQNFYARHWPQSDFFDGSLDEVSVFNSVLTPQQVADMFAAGVSDTRVVAPQSPTASFTSSTNGLSASVDASGSTDPDGTVDTYAWNFGDSTPTVTTPTATHTYAAAGTYTVTLTVTDNTGRTGTTSREITVAPAAEPVNTTVVATGSQWPYRYAAGAPPTGWNALGFDASAWTSATASLGFPASTVTTNIDTSGGVTANRALAAYFTKTFQVPSAAKAQALTLTTRADDGVVVYVNGTEVARSNMPAGTVTSATYAGPARNTATATAAPVTVNVPVSLLRDGANVVSAETHLNSRSTRDMSFELQAVLRATP